MDYFNKKKKKNAEKKTKENTREIKRNINRVERDIKRAENDERRIVSNIKTALNNKDEDTTQMLIKEVTNVRANKRKLMKTRMDLSALLSRISGIQSTANSADILGKVSKNLGKINETIKTEDITKNAMKFEFENDVLSTKQEIVEGALDQNYNSDSEDRVLEHFMDQREMELNENLVTKKTGVTNEEVENLLRKYESSNKE